MASTSYSCLAQARSTAFASVSTSSAAPVVTQSEFNAVMSTLPSTVSLRLNAVVTSLQDPHPASPRSYFTLRPPPPPMQAMLLAGGPAQWPASFALPTAFDVFRVDWNAAHPAAGWSDARRAWETLPQDIVGVYQRRATAALLAPPPCPPPMVRWALHSSTSGSALSRLRQRVEAEAVRSLLLCPQACSSPELTTSQAPLASTLLRPQQASAAGTLCLRV